MTFSPEEIAAARERVSRMVAELREEAAADGMEDALAELDEGQRPIPWATCPHCRHSVCGCDEMYDAAEGQWLHSEDYNDAD